MLFRNALHRVVGRIIADMCDDATSITPIDMLQQCITAADELCTDVGPAEINDAQYTTGTLCTDTAKLRHAKGVWKPDEFILGSIVNIGAYRANFAGLQHFLVSLTARMHA